MNEEEACNSFAYIGKKEKVAAKKITAQNERYLDHITAVAAS